MQTKSILWITNEFSDDVSIHALTLNQSKSKCQVIGLFIFNFGYYNKLYLRHQLFQLNESKESDLFL